MANIRITCQDCGPVELPHQNIKIVVCQENSYLRSYRFCCLKCGKRDNRACSKEIWDILFNAGCEVRFWEFPRETIETDLIKRNPSIPVISYDDIIDLHSLLDDEKWLAKFMAVGQ